MCTRSLLIFFIADWYSTAQRHDELLFHSAVGLFLLAAITEQKRSHTGLGVDICLYFFSTRLGVG